MCVVSVIVKRPVLPPCVDGSKVRVRARVCVCVGGCVCVCVCVGVSSNQRSPCVMAVVC